MHNAIPRDGKIVFAVKNEAKEQVRADWNIFASEVEDEFHVTEQSMLFNMGSADAAPVIEKAVADKFIMALQAVDNGPLTTCQDEALAEMVETSSNVASVMTDETSINIVASQRSNVMSNLDNMTNTVKAAFLLAGAEVNVGGKYPAWKMRANSKLTDITVKSYEKLFGKKPLVKGIHAGLECGLFSAKLPGLDCVSFGPDLKEIHTFREKMSISSVQRVWKMLVELLRRMKLKEDELRQVIELVQSLNPRPGSQIESTEAEYVVPDVIVRKDNERWLVELNQESVPRLRVNAQYAGFVRRADTSADNTFMRNQLQEARWFIKSLQSRNETLMKVATQIVEHQRGFLEYGDEAMKPLVLHDIAEAVGMHESTISRVTTQKFMHTPRGIYELKYFFSSHVSTSEGGECSSTAIRAIIKKLVAAENQKKPLSDSKIAGLLEAQGIQVARRTVAKYRESLGIAPSSERKRLM